MSFPSKTAKMTERQPFFGALTPVAVPGLLLFLGVAAIATFYATVFAAAHIVAAESGGGRDQMARVTAWVCAIFLAQGLVPIYRFGTRELPRLVVDGLRIKGPAIVVFVLLLGAAAILFL